RVKSVGVHQRVQHCGCRFSSSVEPCLSLPIHKQLLDVWMLTEPIYKGISDTSNALVLSLVPAVKVMRGRFKGYVEAIPHRVISRVRHGHFLQSVCGAPGSNSGGC